MKNALEKEEALDELGQSFQNYLSILHSDESTTDSMTNKAYDVNSNRMVTLDPYSVNEKIRKASVLHVRRLSEIVDREEDKKKEQCFILDIYCSPKRRTWLFFRYSHLENDRS